ncbi:MULTISPECIES: ABC transporter ATP-binding protein [Hyphomonas]|jgi:ABC-2 type transport system ATP-binding protein|uniref:ABC transporter ATP-binding protein n=2 Tax=Hyphomonas adhaerens TaxID=81029 RepID=A0A069E427_9PROT|nr:MULTISPECIES: ABC transporter ATP-binding protein [Hyphomonas]KCZ84783.1 ABC transporter ATP-binding protein [Hyphomonas adhaerens MHS-3]MBB39225.1 ABC transporter ATP-binding protein [Hyphomonas sp.]HAE27703.1 ABC transporter ATP-binding protein [Hyphomonas adhaerens]
MLDIRNLEKSFGAKRAVQGVSFTLDKGTVLGFLGPNGAGKSTTMRMIAGVLEPDSGDALIDGKSIVSDRRTAQAALGYLPEGAPLYEDMTPPEFLSFMAAARKIDRAKRKDAVERAIADARITTVAGQRIGSLSKGYRRRVGLAGAILHDPPVLLLDEPTDGLDPNQKRAVRALIARMAPTKAILISTHTLTEVPAMCTRAIIVDRGRVVADGTPAELTEKSDDGSLESAFMRLTDQAEANAR